MSTQSGRRRGGTPEHSVSLNEHQPPLDNLPYCAGMAARPGQQVSGVNLAELLPTPESESEAESEISELEALPDSPEVAALALSNVILAIETDYEFYTIFDDVDATVVYVTQLVAAVSDLYRRDVHTTLSISYIGVYTTPDDPWTSTATSNDPSDLLDEFQQSWTA